MPNLTKIGFLNKANGIKPLLNIKTVMEKVPTVEIPATHKCNMCSVTLAKLSDYKVIQGLRFCPSCFADQKEEKNQNNEPHMFNDLMYEED